MKKWLISATVILLLVAQGLVMAQDAPDCEDLAPEGVVPTYFIGLGDSYFAQSNYTNAIIAYSCAVDRDAATAMTYVNRGLAYSLQRNDTAAMVDYDQALAIDETLIAAYNNRGILWMNQGNFGLAINDFTLAVTLDPTYAVGFNNRGLVHAAEGNYDLAIADFEQAIMLDADYAAPHASLGATYTALALASYREYRDLSNDPSGRLPAGNESTILTALKGSAETGSFVAWLPFLTPDGRG